MNPYKFILAIIGQGCSKNFVKTLKILTLSSPLIMLVLFTILDTVIISEFVPLNQIAKHYMDLLTEHEVYSTYSLYNQLTNNISEATIPYLFQGILIALTSYCLIWRQINKIPKE